MRDNLMRLMIRTQDAIGTQVRRKCQCSCENGEYWCVLRAT